MCWPVRIVARAGMQGGHQLALGGLVFEEFADDLGAAEGLPALGAEALGLEARGVDRLGPSIGLEHRHVVDRDGGQRWRHFRHHGLGQVARLQLAEARDQPERVDGAGIDALAGATCANPRAAEIIDIQFAGSAEGTALRQANGAGAGRRRHGLDQRVDRGNDVARIQIAKGHRGRVVVLERRGQADQRDGLAVRQSDGQVIAVEGELDVGAVDPHKLDNIARVDRNRTAGLYLDLARLVLTFGDPNYNGHCTTPFFRETTRLLPGPSLLGLS